ILDREDADVLVGYDPHGNYGHPDHLAVHRIGTRAVELAARRPRLLEASTNRDAQARMLDDPAVSELFDQLASAGSDVAEIREMILTGDDGQPIGVAESELAWAIELPDDVIDTKRRSMECHASQTSDIGLMLALPRPVYALAFGTEYLLEPGLDQPMTRAWPFDRTRHDSPRRRSQTAPTDAPEDDDARRPRGVRRAVSPGRPAGRPGSLTSRGRPSRLPAGAGAGRCRS